MRLVGHRFPSSKQKKDEKQRGNRDGCGEGAVAHRTVQIVSFLDAVSENGKNIFDRMNVDSFEGLAVRVFVSWGTRAKIEMELLASIAYIIQHCRPQDSAHASDSADVVVGRLPSQQYYDIRTSSLAVS